MSAPVSENGVANLPYSRGKVFASLDEYLAHLKKMTRSTCPIGGKSSPAFMSS
jgi:hypothetical protein